MARLSDLTKSHSERLSALARQRDEQLLDAMVERDQQLRAIPAAAKAYRTFDEALAEISRRHLEQEKKSAEARQAALDAAHQHRRDADLAAFERRRLAEAAAERKYLLALATQPARPAAEAQRAHADEIERAKREFDEALLTSQERYRIAIDEALAGERYDVSEDIAEAERKLAEVLSAIPAAQSVLAGWRLTMRAIMQQYRRGETDEFDRFHRDIQALRA